MLWPEHASNGNNKAMQSCVKKQHQLALCWEAWANFHLHIKCCKSLYHSGWGTEMKVKTVTLSNIFFVQLYWWKICLGTFSKYMLHHKTVQHFHAFLTCAYFNPFHRGLSAIYLHRVSVFYFWKAFLLFFPLKNSVVELYGVHVFPSLTSQNGRKQTGISLLEDLVSVTAMELHGNLQCNELLPALHWQPDVLEKERMLQKVEKTELTARATPEILKACLCLTLEALWSLI